MRAFVLLFLVALTGCAATESAVTNVTRDTAKGVVNGVVAQKFPGLSVAPVTDCIIESLSAIELVQILKSAIIGVTPDATALVLEIAQRPKAVQCIAKNSIALLGG